MLEGNIAAASIGWLTQGEHPESFLRLAAGAQLVVRIGCRVRLAYSYLAGAQRLKVIRD
jgi:hypothetical protein